MVWDLRGALLKKEERETSRLLDFEFRHRARTMRMLAEVLGIDRDALVKRVVLKSDDEILKDLSLEIGTSRLELDQHHRSASSEARAQLIREVGDPRPHRLA